MMKYDFYDSFSALNGKKGKLKGKKGKLKGQERSLKGKKEKLKGLSLQMMRTEKTKAI